MFHIIHQNYNIVNILITKQPQKGYTREMKTKLLIFGITGDLSTRKLLPALSAIKKTGDFDQVEVIGVSRREANGEDILRSALGDISGLTSLSVFTMNVANAEDYSRLRDYLSLQPDEQLLVYLSVPPTAASQIVDFMGQIGLCTDNVKILFEKPFGVDLASAQQVIEQAAKYYQESQIYRIDHYLAKEMAQNIVAFRGGNALFTHIWDNASIEKIELRATETIGIEGRAGFYEQTGALRDVLQGHLMQLLALTVMDIPSDLDWSELPKRRYEALRSIQPADPQKAVRAQYDTYETEVDNPGTLTETFVSATLFSDNPKWKDVPLVLTTGKALSAKTTEVRIHFRKGHEAQSNCLTLHIQPNEGVEIELFTKKPGYDREFEAQKLAFSYPDDTVLPDAYEQVIVDAIRSHKSLFTSNSEVLESWRILQPLLDAWSMDMTLLPKYAKGVKVEDISGR
jgi:glucose-6-phosphate 1-dehydrogenase